MFHDCSDFVEQISLSALHGLIMLCKQRAWTHLMQGGLQEGLTVPRLAKLRSGSCRGFLCRRAAVAPRGDTAHLMPAQDFWMAAGWRMLMVQECPFEPSRALGCRGGQG